MGLACPLPVDLGGPSGNEQSQGENDGIDLCTQVQSEGFVERPAGCVFWKLLLGEFPPAIKKVRGVNSVKVYSGAGALRADIRFVAEMDNAGVYEGLLREPTIGQQLGTFYRAMDLTTSSQMFIREVTPDLLKVLSS